MEIFLIMVQTAKLGVSNINYLIIPAPDKGRHPNSNCHAKRQLYVLYQTHPPRPQNVNRGKKISALKHSVEMHPNLNIAPSLVTAVRIWRVLDKINKQISWKHTSNRILLNLIVSEVHHWIMKIHLFIISRWQCAIHQFFHAILIPDNNNNNSEEMLQVVFLKFVSCF